MQAPSRRRPVVDPSSLEDSHHADPNHLPSFLTLDIILELLEIYKTTVYPMSVLPICLPLKRVC